jgi:hypothetical protein
MQIRTLANLLGDAEDDFRRAFRDKLRWHRATATAPAAAMALLPLLTLDRLLAGGALPVDQIRVLVSGAEAMPSLYVDDGGRLRMDALQSFLRQGATLSLTDLGRVVPAIGELAAAMERALGVRCGVNAYVATGGKAAFRPHHDGHDVLVLQCQGAKRWFTYGEPFPYPLAGAQIPNVPEAVWDTVMAAGDLLYLPRGHVHSTLPEEAPSVHLSFGFTEATGVDFLRWLAKGADHDATLRRDLGATLPPGERTSRDAALKSALHALIDVMSVEEFFDDQQSERELLPLMTVAQNIGPDATSVLTSALRRAVALMPDAASEVPVRLGGKNYLLSPLSRELLALVTSRHRITIVDLAASVGLTPEDADFESALKTLLQVALVGLTD